MTGISKGWGGGGIHLYFFFEVFMRNVINWEYIHTCNLNVNNKTYMYIYFEK